MRNHRSNIVVFDSNITQDMVNRRDRINLARASMLARQRREARNNRIARAAFYVMVITIMIGAFDWLTQGHTFRALARGLGSIMGIAS